MLSFFPQMHTNFRKYHLIICVNMCKSVDIITASAFLQLRPVSYIARRTVHLKLIAQQNGAEKGLKQPFDSLLPCWLGLVLIGVVAIAVRVGAVSVLVAVSIAVAVAVSVTVSVAVAPSGFKVVDYHGEVANFVVPVDIVNQVEHLF